MKIYIYTYQWKILIHLKQFLYLFKNNNANIATKEIIFKKILKFFSFYAILDARTKKKQTTRRIRKIQKSEYARLKELHQQRMHVFIV